MSIYGSITSYVFASNLAFKLLTEKTKVIYYSYKFKDNLNDFNNSTIGYKYPNILYIKIWIKF